MTRHAHITGEVTYTPGEGVPLTIPLGPVDLEMAPESVTLSWTADNNATGSAAIPLETYQRYVREGKINRHSEADSTPQ